MTGIDTFVDYYQVLRVPNTASVEQIEDAAKRELKRWTKATTHPNLAKRQEAEQQVKNISEARRVLMDAGRRRSYDEVWAAQAGRSAAVPADAAGGDRDWVALAQKYLTENDYPSAAYAAREATQRQGNNAETWSLRAQANLGLGRLDDALYEARQAAEIEPGNSGYLFNLAQVQESSGQWQAAIASYEMVARLDPGSPGGKLGVANVLLQNERAEEALLVTDELSRRFPKDSTVGYYHGWALVGRAEQVPRVKGDDSYVVTSEAEMQTMRDLLSRAQAATGDSDVREAVRHVEVYLDRIARRRVNVPFGNPVGYFVVAFFGVLIGFSGIGSGSGGGFLFGLLCLGVVAAMGAAAWVPGWKVNARMQRRLVR